MSDKKFDLLVLESLWDSELGSKKSVKPFFDGLSEAHEIKYVYHTFYDDEDIYYFIRKSKSLCSSYYIASHGSRECLHSINDKKIGVKSLKDIFKNSNGKGIFFGSCKFMNEKNAKEILNSTKADWVAGYNKPVDWFDSTIHDIIFWREYFELKCHLKNNQNFAWDIAQKIYKTYTKSINLDFIVFDKYKGQHGGNINNSLQEFKQDNPDFIKLLKT